jgi:predicted Holliday junction resolvase-like endonuclease
VQVNLNGRVYLQVSFPLIRKREGETGKEREREREREREKQEQLKEGREEGKREEGRKSVTEYHSALSVKVGQHLVKFHSPFTANRCRQEGCPHILHSL